MESSLDSIDRVSDFLNTGDIHFLIPPDAFQIEIFIFQFIIITLLIFILVQTKERGNG